MDTTEKDIRNLFCSSGPLDRDEVAMLMLQLVERIQNLEQAPQRQPLTDEEFISMVDSDGIRVDPQLAFTIKEMVEKAHGIYLENSDCHGRDWTERDEEYLK